MDNWPATSSTAAVLVRLLGAGLLLVAGTLLAWFLDRASASLAARGGLDDFAARSGVSDALARLGVRRPVSRGLGRLVFWPVFCLAVGMTCDVLGLHTSAWTAQRIAVFVPRLFVALALIGGGVALAAQVRLALSRGVAGWESSGIPAVAHHGIVAIALLAALEQLGVYLGLIHEAVLIALASLGLAGALSCGLGGREVMAGVVCGYLLRQRLQAGDHVRISGHTGTVREVGLVATVIETEEGGMMNRHSI
ncbi:MAG: mechanosensitive ion channel domain-containing protein, partial [Pirellulaceae bacterium]